MSRKDGKATLIRGVLKKEVFVLTIPETAVELSKEIATICPVRIIKVT
jgi:ferredoxin